MNTEKQNENNSSKNQIEFTNGCPGVGCKVCGDGVETRFGGCFRCATAESVIDTGEDMHGKKVATSPMEKLRYILDLYGITQNRKDLPF